MKRRLSNASESSRAKKIIQKEPDYHLTPSVRSEDGEIIWPAPKEQMAKAREIILECAHSNLKTIIVPDKDGDGLTSGVILHRTLTLLGASPSNLLFHLLHRGENIHSESESALLASYNAAYIFVLDQGSRPSPPLPASKTALVIDHHFMSDPNDKPSGAFFVNACNSPPVATSSLLTYELCSPLHPSVPSTTSWLAAIGTFADLGNTIKWSAPFPDLSTTLKTHTKKALTDAVAMLNAPRRTARYDVKSALDALMASQGPKEVLKYPRLVEAKREVAEEVERCTHTAPKFSRDGRVAVFRIESEAQVHPLIATRWANHLTSRTLEIVLVANSGYLPTRNLINFSCRIARCARQNTPAVDIIAFLKAAAEAHPSGTLRERLGEDFARGHVQASGGIVGKEEFEELMAVLEVGVKPEKVEGQGRGSEGNARVGVKALPKQKNTLMSYFGKGKEGSGGRGEGKG